MDTLKPMGILNYTGLCIYRVLRIGMWRTSLKSCVAKVGEELLWWRGNELGSILLCV